jgi:hypothetical protein
MDAQKIDFEKMVIFDDRWLEMSLLAVFGVYEQSF